MTDLTDRVYWRVLVVRCQLGDAAAFEELVARCQPRLRGFLFKLLAGKEAVDDLAQDVWADVFRDLHQLNDPAAFLPWFYRIARNRAFRLLRGRAPMNVVGSIENIEIADEREDERDFSAEDARAVHSALNQLPPEQREVLLLRFIEDMSYQDIATVSGCPIGTVRSRIHSAKRELRSILEGSDEHRATGLAS
jgi:RNA polymerase sigma-70 factor (ECF subfamily)